MSAPHTTRRHDEILLAQVRQRAAGAKAAAIARAVGVHRITVTLATNAVMDDDIALSGEPAAKVAAAYWNRRA